MSSLGCRVSRAYFVQGALLHSPLAFAMLTNAEFTLNYFPGKKKKKWENKSL